MRRVLRVLGVTAVVLATGIQFVRPERISRPESPFANLSASQPVVEILDRSCGDCHSYSTDWPWYSNVAPVSWWVADHVSHAQSHLNFSEWNSYPREKQLDLLGEICEETEDHAMPLPSYTWVHRDAVLSDAEIRQLCQWTAEDVAAIAAPHP